MTLNPRDDATAEWKTDGQSKDRPSSEKSAPRAVFDELFARLAIHNGLIDAATLASARKRQGTNSKRPLADILVQEGALSDDDRQLIERLVQRCLAKNENDPAKSLSSLHFQATAIYAAQSSAETIPLPKSQATSIPTFTSLADYELIEEIAKGGMGVVYKARQIKLNRLVALKMIRSGELASDEQVRRFYAEAKAAAKLDHSGIVPVYEVGEANGQHFYSMSFIEGKSLQERVKDEGPLAPKEAARLTKSAAEAVQFAHDQGIVHRDIKPHNILLDSKGDPKMTDFGLAKHLHGDSNLTATGQVMGTPSYMAPEQAAGNLEEVGPASDVYALGATLYFLLTGRPPFQAASPVETIRHVIDVEPVPPRRLNPAIPRDLETICSKCLRKDLANRYSTASELSDDLGRWLEDKPILARPVNRAEKTWLWCKRRPAVASLLVAILLIAVSGTVFVQQRERYLAVQAHQRERQLEAEGLVEQLLTSEIRDIPRIVRAMGPYKDMIVPLLEQAEATASEQADAKSILHVRLALVRTNPSHASYLYERLLTADVKEVSIIIDALTDYRSELNEQLWRTIKSGSPKERLRAGAAQAQFDSKNQSWGEVSDDVTTALLSEPMSDSDEWIEMLRPVGSVMVRPLQRRFTDEGADREAEQPVIAAALSAYLRDDPETLLQLILRADSQRPFHSLLASLKGHRQHVLPLLQDLISQSPQEESDLIEKDAFWKKQANAAICLLELGETESIWHLFKNTTEIALRRFIIDRLAHLGANYSTLIARLEDESDPGSRYALTLALAQFDVNDLPSREKQNVLERFIALYQHDPEPGVHSAASWALRHWQQDISGIDLKLANAPMPESRRWFVNSQGQTFAVINGPVQFSMRTKKLTKSPLKDIELTRFALATYEVTVSQFQMFRSTFFRYDHGRSPQSDCPINSVSWYDAVAYCNWLSEQEGISQDQWCYEPNGQGEYAESMRIPPDFRERLGYRLPTDEEWAFVSWAMNGFGFGNPSELLSKYAWYSDNADSRFWPVGSKLPNDFGAFDMHGNAFEWCHNVFNQSNGPDIIVMNKDPRFARVGFTSPFIVRFGDRTTIQPASRNYVNGFRLAKSCPSSP